MCMASLGILLESACEAILWVENAPALQAKHGAPFDEFIGQLAAEMVAVREDFAMTVLNKRKLEAASSVMEVCMSSMAVHGGA